MVEDKVINFAGNERSLLILHTTFFLDKAFLIDLPMNNLDLKKREINLKMLPFEIIFLKVWN